jgi:bacteriorhodopsin
MDIINNVYFWGSWMMVWTIVLSMSMRRHQTVIRLLLLKSLGAVFIASLLMINHQQVTLFSSYFFDWLWTTPLTLLILWALANRQWKYSSPHRRGMRMQLLFATTCMLAFGLIAEQTEATTRWISFFIAATLLAFIFSRIWGVLNRDAQHQTRTQYRLFVWAATFISVAWLIFPLLWLLGPLGLNWLHETLLAPMIAICHLLTKSIFFLFIYFGVRWQERDLA